MKGASSQPPWSHLWDTPLTSNYPARNFRGTITAFSMSSSHPDGRPQKMEDNSLHPDDAFPSATRQRDPENPPFSVNQHSRWAFFLFFFQRVPGASRWAGYKWRPAAVTSWYKRELREPCLVYFPAALLGSALATPSAVTAARRAALQLNRPGLDRLRYGWLCLLVTWIFSGKYFYKPCIMMLTRTLWTFKFLYSNSVLSKTSSKNSFI